MPRTLWKGAIAFGLVHIPVALRPASREHTIDFDWLDTRDMAPIGYQRINKRTGKPVDAEHIKKGYQFRKGQYVLMKDEDFKAANPEATQTVEIAGFIDEAELGPEYFVSPYYLEALKRGEKGYALLREVLQSTRRIALARVVIHSKQHPAAIVVRGPWLMLITMRFGDEILAAAGMTQVDARNGKYTKAELGMARRLVDDMKLKWDPAEFHDTYRDDLMKRIDARVKAGKTDTVAAAAEEAPQGRHSAKVIDLLDALKASLEKTGGAPARRPALARRSNPKAATKRRVSITTGRKTRSRAA